MSRSIHREDQQILDVQLPLHHGVNLETIHVKCLGKVPVESLIQHNL